MISSGELYSECARRAKKQRWTIGENILAQKYPGYAIRYASHILRDRWPKLEYAICKNACFSYSYAHIVLRSRFYLAGKTIASSPEFAFKYARDVIGGRWEDAELRMKTNEYWYSEYLEFLDGVNFEWTKEGF